ncbi:hypothetical protein VTL71DRAFT_2954 [Oculimacula yallundae]|uniref:Uncharacterized protein n=1 Tax=Oculimacula yallundae TaxID=86028 RepID=A0ABR4C5U8_9HELO
MTTHTSSFTHQTTVNTLRHTPKHPSQPLLAPPPPIHTQSQETQSPYPPPPPPPLPPHAHAPGPYGSDNILRIRAQIHGRLEIVYIPDLQKETGNA